MPRPVAYAGAQRTILYAAPNDQSSPARDFVEKLAPSDQAKILALFKMLGDLGRINNKEKFKKIPGSELYELKSFQIRLPCFFQSEGRIIVTHGFWKKGDKIPKRELERAERIRKEDIAKSEQEEG